MNGPAYEWYFGMNTIQSRIENTDCIIEAQKFLQAFLYFKKKIKLWARVNANKQLIYVIGQISNKRIRLRDHKRLY